MQDDPPEITEVRASVVQTDPIAPSEPSMEARADFYQRLRRRITTWSRTRAGRAHPALQYVLLAPDLFHLLCRMMLDGQVSLGSKTRIAATLVYFMSPLDFLPELILGPAAFMDDVALSAHVIHRMLAEEPEAVRRHWAGEEAIADQVQEVLAAADRLLGAGLWVRLRRSLGKH